MEPNPTGSAAIPTGVGNVTIPSGVNVVLLHIYWLSTGTIIDSSYVGVTAGKTYNLKVQYTEYNNGEGNKYQVYNTSNHKYWLYGNVVVVGPIEAVGIVIRWSPTINQQSPRWKDY